MTAGVTAPSTKLYENNIRAHINHEREVGGQNTLLTGIIKITDHQEKTALYVFI